MRQYLLEKGKIHHIFNKSIAGFKIFNKESDFSRILDAIRFFQIYERKISFSNFFRTSISNKSNFFDSKRDSTKLVEIVAYCIMPTHLHLILEQLAEDGISVFMNNIENSYARYFNLKHKRKGPLWEGPFKNVPVKSDEQLLHLTRYVHLNPVTAHLIDRPEDWAASSYGEYILDKDSTICKYKHILDIDQKSYQSFVRDNITYQRELAKIKGLMLDK